MTDLRAYAREAAQRVGLDPDIFERQIQQESGFNPNAESGAGAIGIAQIVPAFHPNVDPRDPEASLDYAAQWMADLLRMYGGRYDLALAAYNCFDDETEVLTRYQHKNGVRGPLTWKRFSELKSHDEVAACNLRSQRITFRRPKARQVYDFDGELIRFTARGVDVRVTPNHRMLVSTHGRFRPRFAEADAVPQAGHLMVASRGHDVDYPLSDDELRIAAWVLTDGTITYSKRSARVLVYQRASKARLIKEVLDRLGWTYSVRLVDLKLPVVVGRTLVKPHEPIMHFQLRAESRDRLLDFLPQKAHLPEWVFQLSRRQFRVFLEAFVDGDGSRHPRATQHFQITGQPRMMDELQIAAVMNGCRASVRQTRSPNYVRLNVVVDRPYTRPQLTREHYAGKVYCVTTQNGTVVTRRNGCVVITGNSGPGNVAEFGGVPPFEETRRYLTVILGPEWETGGGAAAGVPRRAPGTFDPDLETEFQRLPWTCAIRSATWCLKSVGVEITAELLHDFFVPDVVNQEVGLRDASGSMIAEHMRRRFGVSAHNKAVVSWDEVISLAGTRPLAIGGRSWGPGGHWTAVRRVNADGNLELANPARGGYRGVGDVMTRDEFHAIGPFSAVWINLPSPTVQETTWQAFRVANTEGSPLNVREQPTTSAPVMTTLSADGEVQAEGRAWRRVRTPDGRTGWVADEFLASQ